MTLVVLYQIYIYIVCVYKEIFVLYRKELL